MNFAKRKNDILSKIDKSFKGDWDGRIVELCGKINSFENYYTTSSCAGRIVLIVDNDKKKEGLFLKVWHDLISLEELKEALNRIVSPNGSVMDDKLLTKEFSIGSYNRFRVNIGERGKSIKFKQEPCILHVACASLQDAQNLLDKARSVGWKRSGIISIEKNIVELISTEKLEFPIIDGKLLVNDDFLKVIVEKSNENLKKSWDKIEKLMELL